MQGIKSTGTKNLSRPLITVQSSKETCDPTIHLISRWNYPGKLARKSKKSSEAMREMLAQGKLAQQDHYAHNLLFNIRGSTRSVESDTRKSRERNPKVTTYHNWSYKNSILEALKKRLEENNKFKITDEDPMVGNPAPIRYAKIKLDLSYLIPTNTGRFPQLDLKTLCNSDQDISLAFQEFLERNGEYFLEEVSRQMSWQFNHFITHRFGSYVLLKLVNLTVSIRDPLTLFCKANFAELVEDQYASRIMDKLIEVSSDFRAFTTTYFRRNLLQYLENNRPALFLIKAVIRCSAQEEINFIKDVLETDPGILNSKPFQKILVVYCQHCTFKNLQRIAEITEIRQNLIKFLENRFSTQILISMVERNIEFVCNELVRLIKSNLLGLMTTNSFKFLALSLINMAPSKVTQEVAYALIRQNNSIITSLMIKKYYLIFYMYFTIAMTPEQHRKQLNKFTQRMESVVGFTECLISNPITSSESS